MTESLLLLERTRAHARTRNEIARGRSDKSSVLHAMAKHVLRVVKIHNAIECLCCDVMRQPQKALVVPKLRQWVYTETLYPLFQFVASGPKSDPSASADVG